jgi:hypothetical protein
MQIKLPPYHIFDTFRKKKQAAFLTPQNVVGDLPEEKLWIVGVERGLAICDAYK